MFIKSLVSVAFSLFILNAHAESSHVHNESCLLSDDLLAKVKDRESQESKNTFKGIRSRMATRANVSAVESGCDAWECYAGEGTKESPYIITMGVYLSADTVDNYSVKYIESIAKRGVEDFNLALKNSGIETVKLTLNQLVNIPKENFIFKSVSMGDDLVDYANCDTCYNETKNHGADYSLVFHSYPVNTGLSGVAFNGGTMASINLADNPDIEDDGGFSRNLTIVHEIGHMFGAGHQQGIATSGGLFAYSNAVGCEVDGVRVSSVVSAWEDESHVLEFSSPSMACGTSETDNTRTIIENAQRQGSFRDIPLSKGNVNLIPSVNEVTEGEALQVNVVRDGDINNVAYVGLWIEGSAAQSKSYSGDDYRYIKFESGQDTVSIDIETIKNNQWNESDESLTLTLDYPVALNLSESESVKNITVRNSDDKKSGYVSFEADSASITEGDKVTVTLSRNDGVDGELTVNILTEAKTATETNFRAINESIVFLDGEETKTFEIETLKDGVFTETLTFAVNITGE